MSTTALRPLRAGVIGLGVGERHLVAYNGVPGVEVTAICDRNETRLQEVGNRHGVTHRHLDYRRVTEDPDIDLVSICSYDDGHAEQCISAFRHGKHVMVEKPIVLNRSEAESVLRAQQDSGRLITSNLILRASPRFRELKRQIVAGQFGEIFCVEGDYLHNILEKITHGWRAHMAFYCTIFGGGIHLIDLMRWLLESEVVEVSGMGNKVLTRDTPYPFDDTFITLLRFESGALGKCLTTFGPQRTKLHAVNVYGTQRTFINDLPHGKIFEGSQESDERAVTTPYPGVEKGDHIPDFVAAVREGREPKVSSRDVFRVMDVCLAAWDAVRESRTIKVHYLI